MFGQAWIKDEAWRSDGLVTTRLVERPRVSVDEWMNTLEPGDAWLRVAPIDRGWRQERVRVAMPRPVQTSDEQSIVRREPRIHISDTGSDTKARTTRRQYPSGVSEPGKDAPRVRALAAVPPACPAELVERMGADVLAKIEQRWASRQRELGMCSVWTGQQYQSRPCGRLYDPAIKRSDYVHRIVWRRVYGAIPAGLDVHHRCNVTLCQRPDHLQLLSKPENTRRRHQRS